jgi:hypothetical protein
VELRPPEPDLTDGVVILRQLARADVAEITAACRDPEIVRWTTQRGATKDATIWSRV